MTDPRTDIMGVILAGGAARRMGGGDKGRLSLGPLTMIEAVVARLRPQCRTLVLNANGDPARFADLGLEVVPDSLPGRPGPLAGVLAGMDHAAARGYGHILTAAADTPFLPASLAGALWRAKTPDTPIVLAATDDPASGRMVRHPTFGLWPVSLREDLRQALTAGVSKIVLWTERHGTGWVRFPTEPFDPFFNVNAPGDLDTARRLAPLIFGLDRQPPAGS
ncbi:molybdenum cofactor guanylyltransferase MobA [Paenirhodobacter populi]|uniref:Molybdenum cofactor guanylyltransferase n=1 Tax=Paenirhodobacter populi TaxID=2306993 RepID=A0A443ITL4_9RHOB|nr:molybdenum cofactor guanylyltransferase MobA [Sinirhodobacter populi]RWR11040.1 molybdenum cofactor guanylyltransferase MobA [Sinirhodobacter populi]